MPRSVFLVTLPETLLHARNFVAYPLAMDTDRANELLRLGRAMLALGYDSEPVEVLRQIDSGELTLREAAERLNLEVTAAVRSPNLLRIVADKLLRVFR